MSLKMKELQHIATIIKITSYENRQTRKEQDTLMYAVTKQESTLVFGLFQVNHCLISFCNRKSFFPVISATLKLVI
jgi:hypothetical protein